MNTNASRKVVDFGSHLYPQSVFPTPMEGVELTEMIGEVLWNPNALVERYDTAGIDAAVLSQPFYMGHSDTNATAAANDALLELMHEYDQFYGLASVPVGAGGTLAARELQRCLDNGYHGGALETRTDGIELTDEELAPVLEVASTREAPLFVHPKLNNSVAPDALDDRYRLNAVFGREVALAESICKVIHEGLFNQYPGLKLVYHHLGGNIASMIGRVQLQLLEGRWPDQEGVYSYDEFERYLTGNIWIDTSGFFGHNSPLQAAIDVFPPSQILFATDSPYEPRGATEIQQLAQSVEKVVPDDDLSAVMGGNALDILVNTSG